MSKKCRVVSTASIAVLLVCGFACAQENGSKAGNSEKLAANTHSKTEEIETPPTPVSTSTPTPAQETSSNNNAIPQADILKASEAFGHFIGRNLKAPGIEFNIDSIIKGMRDGYAGKPAPMADREYEELMARIQEHAYTLQSGENLKAANAFLEKNAKEPHVIQIVPNELQYMIIREGQGPAVAEHSAPQIHYKGQFLDGTVFGSSEESGEPITIPLDQTIPGFSKGIVGMKEGSKFKLFVHPKLGYGTTGHLPPNSLLIFDIEIVKANAPDSSGNEEKLLSLEEDLNDEDDFHFDEDFEEDNESSKEHSSTEKQKPATNTADEKK
jgi:peptidylprolyl isomerase